MTEKKKMFIIVNMNDFYDLFQSTKFDIVIAAYLNVGREWKHMVNDFRYVRIYYIREGNASLELFDRTLELKEGYLYFIPAFSVLSGVCEQKLGHYFVHIIPDVFTEHFFRVLNVKYEAPMERETADYLFRTIALLWKESTAYARIATDSALRLILSHFFLGLNEDERPLNFKKFTGVFSYIDQHLCEKILLKDLAGLLYMDEVYFSNLFKKTFGISPQQYILHKRLDSARLLLSDPETTIAHVARQMDFCDAAAFTNFFKKHTNITPKEFRRRLFENAPEK